MKQEKGKAQSSCSSLGKNIPNFNSPNNHHHFIIVQELSSNPTQTTVPGNAKQAENNAQHLLQQIPAEKGNQTNHYELRKPQICPSLLRHWVPSSASRAVE